MGVARYNPVPEPLYKLTGIETVLMILHLYMFILYYDIISNK